MQQSWRRDHDKLTFIICLPCANQSTSTTLMRAQIDDGTEKMIGDVNLFLAPSDDSPNQIIGELELMIAPVSKRRHGYGRAAILAFIHYVCLHLEEILAEYGQASAEEQELSLSHFRVKINAENEKSISLFESIGFAKDRDGPNYFGEFELHCAVTDSNMSQNILQVHGIENYEEIPCMRSHV